MRTGTFAAFPEEGIQFLRSLKRNNNREWFRNHKTIYETHVKKPMTDLIEAMAPEFERFAPEMIASPKVSAYRIYRDTRFSKDKSPYKTHVAAVFPRADLGKHQGAGFYVHIDPTEVLIGGGLYMVMPEDLQAIRNHIAENAKAFIRIVNSPQFRKLFGAISGEQLTRVPRGFPADHPAAEYLRHKQFLASRIFEAKIATSPRFHKLIVETFRGILPLVRFLNEPIVRARRTKERQDAMFNF
jgi:uncharacterized protein (TIGR02453 family)